VVHSLVDMFGGNANKNIGDAFVLAWKVWILPNDLVDLDHMRVTKEHRIKRARMADLSVVAFCFCVAAINKSSILAEYRKHPAFLARFPNYRVSMGFGLHFGFAIEGAIGSEFKIDASYLSPNVNMAARLESASAQFGVQMLISHFLIDKCSPELRKMTRQIDTVFVKGSKKPVGLFTVDMAIGRLSVVNLMDGIDHKSFTVRRKYEVRQIREMKKTRKWSDEYEAYRELLDDPDITEMRAPYTKEFYRRFAMAFRNYIAGEWVVAREMLEITATMLISKDVLDEDRAAYMAKSDKMQMILVDQPSQTLLDYMAQFDYIAPDNWEGCRALTAK